MKTQKIILAGCVILQRGKILLLHRIKRNCYELPGGKIHDGEPPEETAIRETKEELNCEVKITGKLGKKDFIEDNHTMTYVWFLAEIKKGEKPTIGEPEKFDQLEYLPIKNLTNYSLSTNMQNLVKLL